VAQAAECVLCKCEAQSSNPSPTKKTKGHLNKLLANIFDSLQEMEKYIEKYNLPKLAKE
jgi:hypothetical protein